jgi:hypothetical protein
MKPNHGVDRTPTGVTSKRATEPGSFGACWQSSSRCSCMAGRPAAVGHSYRSPL